MQRERESAGCSAHRNEGRSARFLMHRIPALHVHNVHAASELLPPPPLHMQLIEPVGLSLSLSLSLYVCSMARSMCVQCSGRDSVEIARSLARGGSPSLLIRERFSDIYASAAAALLLLLGCLL